MRARLVAASGLAVLLTASAAVAAPPWSAPRDVSGTFSAMSQPSIAFGTDGTALLSWGEGSRVTADHTRVASLRRDGTVADAGTVPGVLPVPPQVYGRNKTVVLRARRRSNATGRTRVHLDAAFGTTRRPLGSRVRRVADFQVIDDWSGPALAVSRTGEVAVAWTEFRQRPRQDVDRGEHRVRVAFGRAGRGFDSPRTVAAFPYLNRDTQAVGLAYGARGDLVVAYAVGPRNGGSRLAVAASVRHAGRGFGRRQVLGRRLENTTIAAATAPTGRAVVIWGSQDGGEEVHSPWVVRAAIRPARGRFGHAVVIDPGDAPHRALQRLAVAMAPDGSATALWGNMRGSEIEALFPVRTATASPAGGFGPVTQVADTGLVGAVAAAPDGRTLLIWTNAAFGYSALDFGPGDVVAAIRARGALTPGPPEIVSSVELEDSAPAAAFDPRAGVPTAVWPAGNRTPASMAGPVGSLRLQLATRSG